VDQRACHGRESHLNDELTTNEHMQSCAMRLYDPKEYLGYFPVPGYYPIWDAQIDINYQLNR
jgi:hypothetical protein